MSLGILRLVVLAVYPHQHLDDLGAADGFVGSEEAVRIIGGVEDSGVDQRLNIFLRPMPVDVLEAGRVFFCVLCVQRDLPHKNGRELTPRDDFIRRDKAFRMQERYRIDPAADEQQQGKHDNADSFSF
ncbi:hypothetical protein SDC9_145655 [bioreactor metagenome]|uniref:Uncharacterized protein n=1 Tax=bioreactor metagenome TaxID=1076179 RepID=A0A645E973_9ZZZZ